MPRNSEEDGIIAALQRTEHSLDKAATMQQHQAGNMDRVLKRVDQVDTGYHALHAVKAMGSPSGIGAATYLGGKLGGKAFEEGSMGKDIMDEIGFAGGIVGGGPVGAALSVLDLPAHIERQQRLSTYIPRQLQAKLAGQASIVGEAAGELAGGMKEDRGERQAAAVFKSANKLSEVGGGVPAAAITASNLAYNPASIVPTLEILAGPLMMKVTERLRDFSEKLHSSNQQFEEFSGGMSAVMAMQQARDIELGQERGDRRALSAGYLAEGKHELNKNMGSIEDLFATVKNLGAGLFDRLAASITKPFAEQAEGLQKMVDAIAEKLGVESNESKGMKGFEEEALRKHNEYMATVETGRPRRF